MCVCDIHLSPASKLGGLLQVWYNKIIFLHDELHSLCCTPNINRVVNSRRMGCLGHVACMGEMKNLYKVLVRQPERTIPLRDLDINGMDPTMCRPLS
jgi:hypothetical protein